MEDISGKNKKPKIEFEYLRKNDYTYNSSKKYKYIESDILDRETKKELTHILKDMNLMPNNYLKFVYESYVDYLKDILSEKIVPSVVLLEYQNKKFGLIIKIEENKESNQQLMFYCTKNNKLLNQFFLATSLNGLNKEYDLDNIEISTKDNKSENENEKQNNISNEKSDKVLSETGSNDSHKSIRNNRDNKICEYVSGNVFEGEVIQYLKSKLDNYCIEIPNIFYTINKDKKSIFYNEFDSIFKIDSKIILNKGIVKINFAYDGKEKQFSNFKGQDIVEIPEKSLLFIEVKKSQNFEGVFTELFLKINKFIDFINQKYKTYDYRIIILYCYNTIYISSKNDETLFRNAVKKALKFGQYTIYSFYIYDNIYLYNDSENQKRLEDDLKKTNEKLYKVEKELEINKTELKDTKSELKDTKSELNNTKLRLENLEKIVKNFIPNWPNENIRFINNELIMKNEDQNDNQQNQNINNNMNISPNDNIININTKNNIK